GHRRRQLHGLDLELPRRAGTVLPAAPRSHAGRGLPTRLRRTMMRATLSMATIVLCAAAAAGAGCKAEQPALPPAPAAGGMLPGCGSGSGAGGNLPAPSATAPARTPLDTVPVRGSAPGASTVVVQGNGSATAVALVLPDGSFCVDVPLSPGTTN